MDKNFIHWYQRKYEKISEEPPLDVWDNIARKMDGKEVRHRKRFIPFLTLLIFILVGSAIFYFGHGVLKNKQYIIAEKKSVRNAGAFENEILQKRISIQLTEGNAQNYSVLPKRSYTSSNEKKILEKVKSKEIAESGISSVSTIPSNFGTPLNAKGAFANKAKVTSINKIDNNQISQITEKDSSHLLNDKAYVWEYMMPLEFQKIGTKTNDIGYVVDHKAAQFDSIKPSSTEKKFLVGVTLSYNNPWIINSNWHDAANRSSLNYVKSTYSTSFAFLGGFKFRERKTLWTELSTCNTFKQNYFSYKEGHVSKSELKLNYVQLNSFISFDSETKKKLGSLKTYFSFLAGIHAGYLTSAKQVDGNGITSNVDDNYRKMNVGLLLGGAYTLNWKVRYNLSISVRGNTGILNIYKGSDDLPFMLNKTYNAAVSSALSFYYTF